MPSRKPDRLTTGLFGAPNFADERAFVTAVINVAEHAGWLVHHCRPGMRQSGRWSTPVQGTTGFPDLVLVKGDTVLYRECKMPKGRISIEQHRWIEELQGAGADAAIWYPRDYDETIVPTLMRGIRY